MRRQGSPSAPSAPPRTPRRAPSRPAPPLRRTGSTLFSPRTVAVVGASNDTAKWGHIIARRALASPGDRRVLLVSRRGDEVLGVRTHAIGAGRRRRARPARRPGRAVRAGGWLRGSGGRRRRRRRPGDRGDHGRALRDRCRGSPAGGRGPGDRPRRRRRAGRPQLPRRRRHRDRPPAGAGRCSRPATWPCSARAATWPSTSPASWPTAAWACPGSSRSATRRTSGSSTSCVRASTTRGRGPSRSTPRTSSTAGRSSTRPGRCGTQASRWSCSRPGAARRRCAALPPTPAR